MKMDRITNRIVMLTMIATLIPTLATGVISYMQTRRSVTERVKDDLLSVGTLTARELDFWLRSQTYDIGVFGSSFEVSQNLARIHAAGPSAVEARARLRGYVSSVATRIEDYTELLVLDETGRLVVSSDPNRTALPPIGTLNRLLSSPGTEFGTPYEDAVTERVLLPLVEPVSSPAGGDRLGTMVAQLDVRRVVSVLEAFANDHNGSVWLLGPDGEVLTTSEALTGPGRAVLAGESFQTLVDAGGTVAEFASSNVAMLGTLHAVPQSEWYVLAQTSRRSAYASLERLRNLTAAAVMGLMLLMGGVAYLVGVILVRPLARLTEGVAEVAGGDLSVDLPVTGGGEVGYLTEVFNTMVQRLRRSREELDSVNRELRARNRELAHLSVTDGLTGLFNHRRGMEILTEELTRAHRSGHQVSVLMLDVDHFKQYNDTYGHPAGDEVLRRVSRALRSATRGLDGAIRYGGEEFMLVLPDCDAEGALEAASRILDRITKEPFEGRKVTASIGAAVYPICGIEPEEIVRSADRALYEAKDRGRDRVVLAADVALPQGSQYKREMEGSTLSV